MLGSEDRGILGVILAERILGHHGVRKNEPTVHAEKGAELQAKSIPVRQLKEIGAAARTGLHGFHFDLAVRQGLAKPFPCSQLPLVHRMRDNRSVQ